MTARASTASSVVPARLRSVFRGTVPVATRGSKPTNPGFSNGTDTGGNARFRHVIQRDCSAIRLVFLANAAINGPAQNALTLRAAFEYPTSTYRPVTFNGVRDVLVEPGAVLVSDPIALPLAAGAVVWSRTRVTVSSGQTWPLNTLTSQAQGEGAETGTATTDKTTSGTIAASATWTFGPLGVLGEPTTTKPVIAIVGDSIAVGNGDAGDAYMLGWFERSLVAQALAGFDYGAGGETALTFAGTPGAGDARWAVVSCANSVIVAYGVNDASNGRTATQIQADLTTIYTRLAALGVAVYGATITPPRPDTTDGWSTVANQTPTASNAARVTVNNWIRTTPTPLTGYLEVADAVESARDSGKWKAPGYTGDGTHPSTTGHTAIAAALDLTRLQ